MAANERVALLVNHEREGKCINTSKEETRPSNSSYPFVPLVFIMAATVLQRYLRLHSWGGRRKVRSLLVKLCIRLIRVRMYMYVHGIMCGIRLA